MSQILTLYLQLDLTKPINLMKKKVLFVLYKATV